VPAEGRTQSEDLKALVPRGKKYWPIVAIGWRSHQSYLAAVISSARLSMLDLSNLPPRLRRSAAADYLWLKHGIRLSPLTLAKWACIGGGPTFEKSGRWPLYSPENLDAWARRRLSPPVSTNAELREVAGAPGASDAPMNPRSQFRSEDGRPRSLSPPSAGKT
jgi:hypothetical protein